MLPWLESVVLTSNYFLTCPYSSSISLWC